LLDHGRKIASVYDDTTVRLKKLEQLSEFQRTERIFQKRVRALAEKYAHRPALIRRWKNRGWV
jgi:pterin-4a-carbinolamine dehydratase